MKMKGIRYAVRMMLCSLVTASVAAQEKPVEEDTIPNVAVIGSVQKDRIKLRWATTTALSWRKANRYGYRLERYTVTRNGAVLPQPEKVILSERMVPQPLEAWEKELETNDQAAIMAQALYGERFEVEAGDGLSAIVNLSREQEQRFSFGLMAADQDFEVAQKAGLGYVDTTVKSNEKYAYKVIPLVPEAELKVEEGGIFTGLQDYEPLPEPLELAGVFNDETVILTWNKKLLAKTYSSYIVERSADNRTFEKRTGNPFMNLNNSEVETTDRAFYTDSIANDKTYHYRVKGITPFGETGPPSEVVSGAGKKLLKYVPHLLSKNIISDKEVVLKWEFPEEGVKELRSFNLKRSDTDDGFFETVVKDIPAQKREVTYTRLKPTNYFKIEAVDKNNNTRESFPMLVQPVDSVPPAKPTGLTGTIDSTGVVTLSWKPNTDPDLQGYRIYRANQETEEFSQLTVSPQSGTGYRDSVGIKNLNPKVFYKISALDNRENMSELSEALILKKPDVIPPSAPVFTQYNVEKNTVSLQWAGSSSTDVAGQYLYKKENNAAQWTLVDALSKDKTDYTDKKIAEGNVYSYTLIAKDESGLESEPAPPVTLTIPKTGLKPKVKGFFASADSKKGAIDLSWRYDERGVDGFELYRAAGDEPLRLFKMLSAATDRLADNTGLTIQTNYTYLIRAVFKDGTLSEYSKLTVNY